MYNVTLPCTPKVDVPKSIYEEEQKQLEDRAKADGGQAPVSRPLFTNISFDIQSGSKVRAHLTITLHAHLAITQETERVVLAGPKGREAGERGELDTG